MGFSKSLRTKKALKLEFKKYISKESEIHWTSGAYNRSPNAGNRFKAFFGALEFNPNHITKYLLYKKICCIIQLQKCLETEGYGDTLAFIQGNCKTQNILINPVSNLYILKSNEWVLATDQTDYYYYDGYKNGYHAEPILNEDGTYKKFTLAFRFIGTKELFKELIAIDKELARDIGRAYFRNLKFENSKTELSFDRILDSIESFEELEKPLPSLTLEEKEIISSKIEDIYNN